MLVPAMAMCPSTATTMAHLNWSDAPSHFKRVVKRTAGVDHASRGTAVESPTHSVLWSRVSDSFDLPLCLQEDSIERLHDCRRAASYTDSNVRDYIIGCFWVLPAVHK